MTIELILLVLFAFFLVGFAGKTGIKALLSFLFTAFVLWKVLLPLLLRGMQPLLISFVTVSVTTTVIIILISKI